MPIVFIILADAGAAKPDLGERVAQRFSTDPDCQTLPNVWAIRTNADPKAIIQFIGDEQLVAPNASLLVTRLAASWAASNAKREPDCWKDREILHLFDKSGEARGRIEPGKLSKV